MMNVTNQSGSIRRGVKRWMTKTEIVKLLGPEAAEAVIAHKYSSKKLQLEEIRDHPDAPGSEARLFNNLAPTCLILHVACNPFAFQGGQTVLGTGS